MERNLSGQSFPPSAPLLIPGGVGETLNFGTYDVHWKIDGSQTGRRFSVIHQLVAPRALVAPLHRHHREDEYSYVLTGTFGALLGGFEDFFREFRAIWPDRSKSAELLRKYELDMDLDSIPALCARFGLKSAGDAPTSLR